MVMIFRHEAASADHPCLTYHGTDKPALLSPIAGALQNNRVRVKNGGACLGDFCESNVAWAAVLRQAFFLLARTLCAQNSGISFARGFRPMR